MEFIAYNTALDIKTIISQSKQTDKAEKDAKNAEFDRNKKQLLPFVLRYLHYLTELHNSHVVKNCFVSGDYRTNIRATSLNDHTLQLQDVLEQYTQDCFFKDNGAVWQCNLFHVVGKQSPKIWLHTVGKFQATPHLGYSMTGFNERYGNIEEYIKEAADYLVRLERVREKVEWEFTCRQFLTLIQVK